MEKRLTKEQVSKLYAYCRKMEIYDFDVQIEVVDHLATAIENQWAEHPEIPFGWALRNILQKFGENGLFKLERKLSRQMQRRFNRILFLSFIDFFRIPKIIITVAAILALFVLLQLSPDNLWVIMPVCILLSVGSLIYYYRFFPQKFEIETGSRTFMLINYLKSIHSKVGSVVQLPFLALLLSNDPAFIHSNSTGAELLISAVLAVLSIFLYAYFIYLPARIKEYFEKNYLQFAD